MKHARKNLSLRDVDTAALLHARQLQASLNGLRLEDDDEDDTGDEEDEDEEEDDDTGDEEDEEDDEDPDVEKWKKLSRKHERRSKENLRRAKQAEQELEAAKREKLPPDEQAIEAAKAEARREALLETGAKLVDAEIKASAAGRMSSEQLDTLLEGLDRSRFLDEDGDVETDMVETFVDGIAPAEGAPGKGKQKKADLGQGRRNGKAKTSVASGRSLYQERRGSKNT